MMTFSLHQLFLWAIFFCAATPTGLEECLICLLAHPSFQLWVLTTNVFSINKDNVYIQPLLPVHCLLHCHVH